MTCSVGTKISGSEIVNAMTLTVNIHVTGLRWLTLRLWIGTRLIRLAGGVIGCSIVITGPE